MLHRLDCPSCGATTEEPFYSVRDVPVQSVVLLSDRRTAKDFPRGDIELSHCPHCDFIFNRAFDPGRVRYGAGYEATQAFSGTFNAFHRTLAKRLVETYGLVGKTVLEIGCGQGEFLRLMCEEGCARGIGFDPAFDPDRAWTAVGPDIEIIADVFSEACRDVAADLIVCKMTLEHIPDVARFLTSVRRAIDNRRDTIVFFMVPNAEAILGDLSFWDIYYEHCSYFTASALTSLFERTGFQVLGCRAEYEDQYLIIEARPGDAEYRRLRSAEGKALVAEFRAGIDQRLAICAEMLAELHRHGQRVVIWGGGSKAVAFLTTLRLGAEIESVIDINPLKHGSFLPGTGHEVVGPATLRGNRPDLVLAMNHIYTEEIARELASHGVNGHLVPATTFGLEGPDRAPIEPRYARG